MNNIYLVQCKSGNVIVSIMRNKSDNTYSFVNLTRSAIINCISLIVRTMYLCCGYGVIVYGLFFAMAVLLQSMFNVGFTR